MHKATIGGVPGAAMTRAAPQTAAPREWRGIFMFRPEHQAAMARLSEGPAEAVLESVIDGRTGKLDVTLTGLAEGAGLAFFEAEGEPY